MFVIAIILTIIGTVIALVMFGTFLFAWIEEKDPASEMAWFHSWVMYSVAAAMFAISTIIGWEMVDETSYGELVALTLFIDVLLLVFAYATPKFNFRSIEEARQYEAG